MARTTTGATCERPRPGWQALDLTPEEAAVSSLERLSADSVARGGPAKVTLIGHSLGGVIATYFISRRTPDEFGAVYGGNVARVITIGTPHLGIRPARS